jgi:hypothetical protein
VLGDGSGGGGVLVLHPVKPEKAEGVMKRFFFWLAVLLLGAELAGCGLMEARVKSPVSGQQVTADELVAEAERERDRLEREAKAELDAKEAELRRLAKEAKVRALEIKAGAQQNVAAAESELAALELETGAQVDQVVADVARFRNDLDVRLASLEGQVNSGIDLINKRRQEAAGIFNFIAGNPIVAGAAGSAGIDLAALGTLILGGGGVVAAWRTRRSADRTIEAERKAAEAKRVELENYADQMYDESADKTARMHRDITQQVTNDLLRLLTKPPSIT